MPTWELHSVRVYPIRTVERRFAASGIGQALEVLQKAVSQRRCTYPAGYFAAIAAKLTAVLAAEPAAVACEGEGDSAAISDSAALCPRPDELNLGVNLSARLPWHMPLRAFVRSVFVVLWTGHGGSRFVPARVEDCAAFHSCGSVLARV